MTVKLSPTQKKIWEHLKFGTVKSCAEYLHTTEDSISVQLHRIRRKYKQARAFVNWFDAQRQSNANLRQHLKTREMKD